jgi:hypothetical protein
MHRTTRGLFAGTVAVLLASPLGACGHDGGTSAPAGPASPSTTQPTASSTSKGSTTATATPTQHPTEAARVRVTSRPERTVVDGSTAVRRRWSVAATSAGTAGAASRIESQLNEQSATMLAEWTTSLDQNGPAPAGSGPGGYEEKARVVTDEGNVLAVAPTFYEYLPGAAHPVTLVRPLTFDTRTGAVVTPTAMLAEMQRLGGPGWDFERELRRGATRAVPQESSADLTRRDVSLWPARSGLAGGIDHCGFYSCAAGLVEFTIPWTSLVGPGDEVSVRPTSSSR